MNKPHMMFQQEMAQSMADGAQMMEEMVKDSLKDATMPPRPVFAWFAKYATYRFVAAEFAVAHGETELADDLKALSLEVHMLREMAANQQMFGVQTAINDILRQRTMHLPPGYQPLISP